MWNESEARFMGTILIDGPITKAELRAAGEELFGEMVKAVVDVEKGVMSDC